MKTETTLDYAKPYEIMCGIWTGMANVYGPDGTYSDCAPSRWSCTGRTRRPSRTTRSRSTTSTAS